MGLLQPYRGTYVSAESASGKLDAAAIIAGCDAVDAEANHISEYAGKISSAASGLNQDTFSVNGETVTGKVDECCTGVTNVESNILNTTSQIRELAESIYNQIQEQMNIEAQARDQAEAQKRNS